MTGQEFIIKNQYLKNSLHRIFNSKCLSSFYFWSEQEDKWIPKQQKWLNNFQRNKLSKFFFKKRFLNQKINIIRQIKSVTYNVLFDFRSSEEPDKDRGHMKYSTERYEFILKEWEKTNCDIITLNEVTRPFIKMIEKKQWIRKSYKISTCHDSPYGINGIRCFGNIILTKIQPLALHVYKVLSLPRPIPIDFFLVKNEQNGFQPKIITFSSIHLTAYDIHFQRRQKQLTSIKNYLNNHNFCTTHVLQGDMNFHSEKENINFKNNQLLDCWLKVNNVADQKDLEKNPGYTFDSEKNYFIKQLYWGFEKRRMRLDRIFLSTHNQNILEPKEIKVIFDKPVYENLATLPSSNIIKSALSFLGDKAKLNIFRLREKYLFGSDHFGLECKFKVL